MTFGWVHRRLSAGSGSVRNTSSTAPEKLTGIERAQQVLLDDQPSPSDVYEVSASFHERQRPGIDDVARLFVSGRMQTT